MNKFLLTLTLTLAAFMSFALPISHVAAEAVHADHILKGYLDVTKALYEDDLPAAREAATELGKRDADSAIAKPASEVASAKDMKAARVAFISLSAAAIRLAKEDGDGRYTVMHCPMVKGGQGNWLSADGKVNNPYFGARMPHCGGPAK